MYNKCKDLYDLADELKLKLKPDAKSPLYREGEGAEFARKFFNAYQKCLPEVSIDYVVKQLETRDFLEYQVLQV